MWRTCTDSRISTSKSTSKRIVRVGSTMWVMSDPLCACRRYEQVGGGGAGGAVGGRRGWRRRGAGGAGEPDGQADRAEHAMEPAQVRHERGLPACPFTLALLCPSPAPRPPRPWPSPDPCLTRVHTHRPTAPCLLGLALSLTSSHHSPFSRRSTARTRATCTTSRPSRPSSTIGSRPTRCAKTTRYRNVRPSLSILLCFLCPPSASPSSEHKCLNWILVKYKIPSNFFNPNTQFRLPALHKALEQLPLFQYDQPEACNLHETSEVHCHALHDARLRLWTAITRHSY